MEHIHFVKMQATGNDFILIDARELERDWSKLAKAVCHRRLGIGGDGLILLLGSEVAQFRMCAFNLDGSEAEACGNGLRCLVKYVIESGLAAGDVVGIETKEGVRTAQAKVEKGIVTSVRVGMGMPEFVPERIPVALRGHSLDIMPILGYPISVAGRELKLDVLSMGNPHAVLLLDEEEVTKFPLSQVGPEIEYHPMFPNRVNFEIANVVDSEQVIARVWERGVGETLSCGTGACAIAVAAYLHGLVDNQVDITLPGGMLTVDWDGVGEVFLSGPAEMVFEGKWRL
jgi:diaminopimelate epimerase